MKNKEKYLSPSIEVIKMAVESSVMVGSVDAGEGYGPGVWQTAAVQISGIRHYDAASTGNPGNAINNILTVKK